MTLAGYFWPLREIVRIAKDTHYASSLRVAVTCTSMVAIAVVVLVPTAVEYIMTGY